MSLAGKVYVIGIGPGEAGGMTVNAREAIEACEVLAGYTVYIDQVRGLCDGKELIVKGMGREKERCELALERALSGRTVGIVCSGDSGLYGMAGLLIELVGRLDDLYEVEVEIVPGVTAALSCSALLGAPIVEDFCTISLSDYMTPYEKILDRVKYAAKADFTIALYNPRSSKRPDYLKEALDIIGRERDPDTPVGIVRMAYRKEQEIVRTTLSKVPIEEVDMFCTLLIGNHQTKWIGDWMVTSRGYAI